MGTLLIAIGAGVAFLVAYHTYGRWLGGKIFELSGEVVCPSERLADGCDYVKTPKAVVFGHHFTSIAGTGPIVGPAIAVMWGWVPALLWVVLGSIFIGAVHDFGALVVSLRNDGQTVGEIAGRLLNRRVRLLFLLVLFMALTIVLAIFGLVIAAVFKQYPAAIFPCMIQIPIAVLIGLYLQRKGVGLFLPSLMALLLMYVAVVFGDVGWLGSANEWMAGWPVILWVGVLLGYSYVASVLPVWVLLQPRDYINSLQLLTALALIVVGLVVAAFVGGAPPVEGAERVELEIAAPAWDFQPSEAPLIFPFLFITIACGAISGFHCLVSSGTSSKQLACEPDARFVGYGSMLTEGFLATLVILACVAGLGLGASHLMTISHGNGYGEYPVFHYVDSSGMARTFEPEWYVDNGGWNTDEIEPADVTFDNGPYTVTLGGAAAWNTRYASWTGSNSLGAKVGAFVDGSANFLKALGVPGGVAIALMGVLVASFAGTTLDTACRLQRYVVQELAAIFLPSWKASKLAGRCFDCDYDLTGNASGECSECGLDVTNSREQWERKYQLGPPLTLNPVTWLRNKYGATLFAVLVGGLMAAVPLPGSGWSVANAGKGGLILWPMFGATNQLLAGMAFLVIAFFLWRRGKAIWFLVLPLIFMLVMPAWAMLWQLLVQGVGAETSWLEADNPNWVLILIAVVTLVLEVWMIFEAVVLFPKVKGVLEGGKTAGA